MIATYMVDRDGNNGRFIVEWLYLATKQWPVLKIKGRLLPWGEFVCQGWRIDHVRRGIEDQCLGRLEFASWRPKGPCERFVTSDGASYRALESSGVDGALHREGAADVVHHIGWPRLLVDKDTELPR